MSVEPETPEPPEPPPAATGHTLSAGEAIAASQVAAHATESHGHHGPFHTHCENCGTKLEGPWCHRCGQHDFEFHRSFWHVFMEALETLFHFEGKFFRNIVTLLFQPGRLTADFNAGKRAAQMPPFRLYIFVSFVFFLLIFLGGDKKADSPSSETAEGAVVTSNRIGEAWKQAAAGMDDADWRDPVKVANTIEQATAATPTPAGGDPAAEAARQQLAEELRAVIEQATAARTQMTKTTPAEPPGIVRHLVDQARRMNDRAHRERLLQSIKSHLPHLLMFCLPLFALYTRVLFRKSGQVYLQHLVLAVHFHTFIFLWLLCTKGWVGLADLPGWGLGDWVAFVCTLWLYIYPCLMLRRLFTNSWPKTVLKTCLLAFGYMLTLGLGFMVMAIATFLLA